MIDSRKGGATTTSVSSGELVSISTDHGQSRARERTAERFSWEGKDEANEGREVEEEEEGGTTKGKYQTTATTSAKEE